MRIALFSDIHANLVALEALFIDLKNRPVDQMYCLGDLVGYNSYPNEVIEQIRLRGITTISGNHDYRIGRLDKSFREDLTKDPKELTSAISINYTNMVLTDEARQYLRCLPLQIKLNFEMYNQSRIMLLVHGSAVSIDELLYETTSEDYLWTMMDNAGADIMCFGHTHKPYYKQLTQSSPEQKIKHVINIGSIGKPKDGDPRGCYAVIDINEGNKSMEDITVEFVRFDYDIEQAVKGLRLAHFPEELADMLRKAY